MPLFKLISSGDIQGLIELLHTAPEEYLKTDTMGRTPLEYALCCNQPQAFGVLYKFHQSQLKQQAEHHTEHHNNERKSAQESSDIQATDTQRKNIEFLKLSLFKHIPMLSYDINVNVTIANAFLSVIPTEDTEYDMLMFSILEKLLKAYTSVKRKKIEIIKDFLREGRGILGPNPSSWSEEINLLCLIIESYSLENNEKMEILEFLLKTHSDKLKMLAKNSGLSSEVFPFTRAATAGLYPIVNLFLEFGAEIPRFYEYGDTLLHILIDNLPSNLTNFEEAFGFLLKIININVENGYDESPIFRAVSRKNIPLVNFLIEKGADIKKRTTHGTTLLMRVCDHSNMEESSEFLDLILHLCQKMDVNAIDILGDTALHKAIRNGYVQTARILLKFKADVNAVNASGCSVWDCIAHIQEPEDLYSFNSSLNSQKSRLRKQSQNTKINEVANTMRNLLKEAGASDCSIFHSFNQAAEQFVANLDTGCASGIQKRISKEAEDKTLAEILDAMEVAEVPGKEDAVTCQTMVNHKHLLWSFTQRNSKQTVKKSAVTSTCDISFGTFGNKLSLKFRDMTERDDYTFIIHTTSTAVSSLREKLSAMLNDDPKFFIKTTPYFSCSIVDKNTPPGEMHHQVRNIFPISFILDLHEGSVLKAFPSDVGSPYGAAEEKRRKEYIKQLEGSNAEGNALEFYARKMSEVHYADQKKQSERKTQNEALFSLDLLSVHNIFKKSKHFVRCSYGSSGKLPEYSPGEVLKETGHGYYNELIVLGHPRNQVMGIMIEKHWLEDFRDLYLGKKDLKLNSEAQKNAQEVLQMLAQLQVDHPEFPLILVNTREKVGLEKLPMHEQLEPYKKQYDSLSEHMSELFLYQYRLRQSIERLERLCLSSDCNPELQTLLEKQRENLEKIHRTIQKDGPKLLEVQDQLKGIRDSLR